MRIGEVTRRSGLSTRMIRYYERRGRITSSRSGTAQRRFTDEDVRRLRMLRALIAAGARPDDAVQAIDGGLAHHHVEELRATMAALGAQLHEAERHLAGQLPASDASSNETPEDRISLMFDTFMVRTRMLSFLSQALEPAGVAPADYALLSLLVVDACITPATLARLVGIAPSTLARRLDRLIRRGWVRRRVHPANPRSWLIELTPTGQGRFDAALPHAIRASHQIHTALYQHDLQPDTIRLALVGLSNALRSLLPDADPPSTPARTSARTPAATPTPRPP